MAENVTLTRRLLVIALALAAVILIGTVGYMVVEGWSITDAAYMTVITLSTVGFSEVRALSPTGRWFTMGLILVGVGGAAYLFSTVADYIVAGELRGTLQRRRMQRRVDGLSNHYIVCGFGRVGQQVVAELSAHAAPLVIIDRDPSRSAAANAAYPIINGDASDDDVLQAAGIERASGLIAAAGTDADNLFITLSARALKRDLVIVARGILPDSERKLRKAGADHVILPHAIGGRRMAAMLMHPSVVDFLDVVMHSENLELWLEDVAIAPNCRLDQCTVGSARVRTETGANILAIKTAQGQLITNVDADYLMVHGDVLVALGTRQQLASLVKLATSA